MNKKMVPSENNGKMVSPDATPSNTVRTSPSTAGDGNGYGFGHPQDDHHQKDGRQALLVALEAEGGKTILARPEAPRIFLRRLGRSHRNH